jgi:hypothetical protein
VTEWKGTFLPVAQPTSEHAGLWPAVSSCTQSLDAAVPRRKGTNKFSSVPHILRSCPLPRQKEALSFNPESQGCGCPLQGTCEGGTWAPQPSRSLGLQLCKAKVKFRMCVSFCHPWPRWCWEIFLKELLEFLR